MSLITPSSRPRGGGAHKGGARRYENNRIYGNPLPLLFIEPPPSRTQSVLGLLGLSLTRVENPHCEGVFDPITRSVWVSKSEHYLILWRRGFFGKGDLSRSDPSWLARQMNIRKTGGKQLTSEEITAQRRAERKQFKLDRARAIAAVAEEAETIFATEGRVIQPALSGPDIPSAATWKPSARSEPEAIASTSMVDDEPLENEEPLEDVEHLQLTLQEAFFLLWNLDCLTILEPQSMEPMTLQQIWIAFQITELPPQLPPPSNPSEHLQFDNPFLINYVVYHHYRSLGWVVKGGIKFCVDYLLYKRGPVFNTCRIGFGGSSSVRGPRRPEGLFRRVAELVSIRLVLAEHHQSRKFTGSKDAHFGICHDSSKITTLAECTQITCMFCPLLSERSCTT